MDKTIDALEYSNKKLGKHATYILFEGLFGMLTFVGAVGMVTFYRLDNNSKGE